MADIDRIKRNVSKMVSGNAPEADIDAYIQSEGVTVDAVRSYKAPPMQTPVATGNIAAGLEGVAQGVTFGFSDELEGAARAAYAKLTGDARPISDLYAEGVEVPRQRIATASETNPAAFYTGEIGSSFLVPGGLARTGVKGAVAIAAGAAPRARALAGLKEGAAYGAAYGAGKADSGVANTIEGAGVGALTGGAFGAVAPSVVDGVASVARGVATPFRAAMNPKQFAGEKVAEAAARDLSRSDGNAGNAAMRLADRMSDMQDVSGSVRLMDAGGENVRGLMRSAANMPNQQREGVRRFVDARQGNQYARLTEDLQSGLNEGRNFFGAVNDQVQKMEQIGSNVLDRAVKIETPMTPELRRVLARPTMQDLAKLVSRKLADEDKPIGLMTRTEMLHRMKIELDRQIGMAVRAEKTGNTPTAGWDKNTLSTLKRDLLKTIDNNAYKRGLQGYAGEARLKDAAEQGRDDFFKMAPEELKATIRSFDTDAERQMFRLGAGRAIIDRLRTGNSGRDRTDNLFGSPQIQMQLRELFPDQKSFREFQKALVVEAKMADTRKALQGNSTTAKQLAEGDQAGKTSRMVMSAVNAATGKLEPMLNLAAQGYNRFTGLTPSVANEILRLGMSKSPDALAELARKSFVAADKTPRQRAEIARALMAAMGNATTQRVGQ